jgi:SnoaL-like domain
MDPATGAGTDQHALPATDRTDDVGAVVVEYLTAFYTGDFDRARTLLAPNFSFRGPFLQIQGRDGFFAGAQGLRPIVRGHRLLRQWVDGTEVCSIYDVTLETPSGSGSVPMSEWHTVHAGRLTTALVLFDTTAFRSLLPAP